MDEVAIVILAYNSVSKNRELYEKCIVSSLKQNYPYKHVIIVDNGSTDNTYDFSKKYCSGRRECVVVKLLKNLGWAGGNNRGAILAKKSKYILFLNDDAYFMHSDCVSKLVECMERYPRLGAVQPVIINRDGTVNLGGVLGFSGFSKLRVSTHFKLSYLSGATLLVRTQAFFEVGMFDENLFLYHDDVDFSWRLRARGWDVAVAGDCFVFHWGSATLGEESPIYLYYMLRNNLWVLAKNSPLHQLPFRFSLALFGSLIGFVGHYAVMRRDPIRLKAILRGLADGLRNIGQPLTKGVMRVSGHEDPWVDVELLVPTSLRKAFGKIFKGYLKHKTL